MGRASLVLLVAAFLSSSAAQARALQLQPWMWTPPHAAAKLSRAVERVYTVDGVGGSYGPASCRGMGRAMAGRFTSFSCIVRFTTIGPQGHMGTKRAWLKVRPVSTGGACISFVSAVAVSSRCLTTKGLVTGRRQDAGEDVRWATARRFDPAARIPWQTFTALECIGVDGYHECSFTSLVSGSAVVLYRAAGPTVIFTSLTCHGAYADRPECTLRRARTSAAHPAP